MRDRRLARCIACNETFSYLIDITEEQLAQNPIVKLACPFCGVALEIDLSPYRQNKISVFRGETSSEDLSLELPEELPTEKAED